MESLLNPAVVWFIIGLALFLLELVVPGLVLVFFGVGSWLVGGLTFAFDLSINQQLIVFITASILFLILFRKKLQYKLGAPQLSKEIMEDEFIGKTAIAETDFAPGQRGKVTFRGASWDARSTDAVQKGEEVLITGNESIVLIIKSKKS